MMIESEDPPRRRSLTQPLRILLMVGLMAPVVYAIIDQWGSVQATLSGISWPLALASWIILLIAQPFMGAVSWVVLRYLHQFFPIVKVSSVYFISQAAKYLPGGIWAFPSRVVAYRMMGVEKDASLISLVQEVAAMFLGAAGLGLAALIGGLEADPIVRTALIFGILSSCVAVILAQHPAVWRLISRVRSGANVYSELAVERRTFDLSWMPPALITALFFWLLIGWGFKWLAVSVDPQAAQMSLLDAAGIFTLAWCAGFVVVFAPSGLGVRESAMTALLLPYMPIGTALSLALLARLWWMLGEALFIAVSLVLRMRK